MTASCWCNCEHNHPGTPPICTNHGQVSLSFMGGHIHIPVAMCAPCAVAMATAVKSAKGQVVS